MQIQIEQRQQQQQLGEIENKVKWREKKICNESN